MFLRSIAGRYRPLSILGRGSSGTVYLCLDTETREQIAVKRLKGPIDDSLFEEYSLLKKLDHPNIVRVIDVGRDGGTPYITMEYILGVNFVEYLLDVSNYTEVARSVAQLFLALDYLQRQDVVHQDVKPSNCYVEVKPSGIDRVKLLDFGLASRRAGTAGVGTPDFMAPEVLARETWLRDGDVDHRADLFGAGAMLYLALTGRYITGRTSPCPKNDPRPMLEAFRKGITPIARHNPKVPRALQVLVMRLLALDRNERPASAYDLKDELLREFPSVELESPPASSAKRAGIADYIDASGARNAIMTLVDRGTSAILEVEGRRRMGKSDLLEELGPLLVKRDFEVVYSEYRKSGDLSRSPIEKVTRRAKTRRSRDDPQALEKEFPALFGGAWETSAQATEDQMYALLLQELHDGPVAVLIDDAQWADASSLTLFLRAASRVIGRKSSGAGQGPLLVVVTVAPDSDAPKLDEVRSFLAAVRTQPALELTEFSREQIRSYLESMRRWTGNLDELIDLLDAKASGVPGKIVDVLLELEERHAIERGHGSGPWRIDTQKLLEYEGRTGLDDSGAVLRRVAQLPLSAASVLQAIAVFDQRPVVATELQAVTQLSAGEVEEALERVETTFLRKADRQYRFRTTSDREAIYEAIQCGVREQLHGRVAHLLEQRYQHNMEGRIGEVARHYARSADREAGRRHSINAGRELAARGQHIMALPHFADATALCEESVASPGASDAARQQIAEVYLDYVASLLAVGEPDQVLRQVQPLLERCERIVRELADRVLVLRARATAVGLEVELFRWRHVEGEWSSEIERWRKKVETELEALHGSEDEPAQEVRSELLKQLGFLYSRLRRFSDAARVLRGCLEIRRTLGRPVNRILTALARSLATQGDESGKAIAEEAVETATTEGDILGLAEARAGLGWALGRLSHRSDSAALEYEEALRIAESPTVGSTKQAELQFVYSELLAELGQAERSLDLARKVVERFPDAKGSLSARAYLTGAKGLVKLCRYRGAGEYLAKAKAYTKDRLDQRQARELDEEVRLWEGRLLIEKGRYDEGVEVLRKMIEAVRPPDRGVSGEHFFVAAALMSVADVHVRRGWVLYLDGQSPADEGRALEAVCREIASVYAADEDNAATMGLKACAGAYTGERPGAWRAAADLLEVPAFNLYQAYGSLYTAMAAIMVARLKDAHAALDHCRALLKVLQLADVNLYVEALRMIVYAREGRLNTAMRHRKELAKAVTSLLLNVPGEEDSVEFKGEPFRAALLREGKRLG